MSSTENEVPLSSEAQEAKELMQRELLRKMANKMMVTAIEEERQLRIKAQETETDDVVKQKALDQIVIVQEDLVRTLNLMKVKADAELEQAQRITEGKKQVVHSELLRNAAAKQADKDSEEERKRRIDESKDQESEVNFERRQVYDRLVKVQEDLLKTVQRMQVDEQTKQEQQRRVTEDKKKVVHEELVHAVGAKSADFAMEKERQRRLEETLSEDEVKRRVNIAHKMIDVQKELLATHAPTKPIQGTLSQEVLEEAKAYVQEQLLRKAAQKEAITAMDEEQKRRIAEAPQAPKGGVSDAQATVLEDINRRANRKSAHEMEDAVKQEYIQEERKSRAQEEAVRKVHQKEVDKAMDKEKEARISGMKSKEQPHIGKQLKKQIEKTTK